MQVRTDSSLYQAAPSISAMPIQKIPVTVQCSLGFTTLTETVQRLLLLQAVHTMLILLTTTVKLTSPIATSPLKKQLTNGQSKLFILPVKKQLVRQFRSAQYAVKSLMLSKITPTENMFQTATLPAKLTAQRQLHVFTVAA